MFRQALGTHPLAIASGVSVENVASMLGKVDAFLVASSVLLPDEEIFDRKKLGLLASLIHQTQ